MDIDISCVSIDPVWAMKISPAIALRRLAMPLCVVDGELCVAMADPSDTTTIAAISSATGKPVKAYKAEASSLRALLVKVYGDSRQSTSVILQDDAVSLVDNLLRAATIRYASDIHFDPDKDGIRVRMRIDGELEDFMHIRQSIALPLCSRLKIMGGLDIAERRAPQDGGFSWKMPTALAGETESFDVRMATLPVRYGERITLRLLESGRERLTLDKLGMSEEHRRSFQDVLSRPHGLVLLTGPTGSGKTTTLYAAIRALLDTRPLNILTVEDPVEYEIPGIAQAEVDSSDKVNFSKALRSLLRHDPDVIMIGEIRDTDSLDVAVKAALTGHLVLSTLHTNNAVGAVTRLLDMGLAPHMIAATLRLSVAQRLVRALCPDCRMKYIIDRNESIAKGCPSLEGDICFRPTGCLKCAGRGYKGRTGLFELFAPDAETASMIASGANEHELLDRITVAGYRDMNSDARSKLLCGITDLDEVLRAMGTIS